MLGDAIESERMSVPGAFDVDCVPNYAQACPDRYVLEGSSCTAPVGTSGRCGSSLSSKYNTAEKAAYAEACLTPWSAVPMIGSYVGPCINGCVSRPCVGDFAAASLK